MGRKKKMDKMVLKSFLIDREKYDELTLAVSELNKIYLKTNKKPIDNSKCIRLAIEQIILKMKEKINSFEEKKD